MQFEAFCKCNSHQYLFVVRKCCDFAKFMHGGNNQRKSQQKHFETEYNRESFTYHGIDDNYTVNTIWVNLQIPRNRKKENKATSVSDIESDT